MAVTILEWITRFAPAGFFGFVAIFYTVRILLLQHSDKQKRTSMRSLSGGLCPAHILFRVLRVLILIASIGYAVDPELIEILGPLLVLTSPWVMILGDMMLFGAFAFVCSAHMTMGDSWRSGIPLQTAHFGEKAKPIVLPLVTHGLFAWSRNPTYIGVAAGQLGFFLAIPTFFSLACLLLGLWALSYRVKKEEEFLLQSHGEAYRTYCETTPRWIGLPRSLRAEQRKRREEEIRTL